MDIVLMLSIGAAMGWLASLIFAGRGPGSFGNIIAGLLGSVLGYWLWGILGVTLGIGYINTILSGLSGSLVIIGIVNLFFPGRKVDLLL